MKNARIIIENDGVNNKNPYIFSVQGIGKGGIQINVSEKEENNFHIFPNPCNSFITIQNSSDFVSTHPELISLDGKKCPLGKIESSNTTISLPQLPDGRHLHAAYLQQ